MLRPCLILIFSLLSLPAHAGSGVDVDQVRHWREANEQIIINRFVELLSIPNVATDTINIRRNAEHIMSMLSLAGMEGELLDCIFSPPKYQAGARPRQFAITNRSYIRSSRVSIKRVTSSSVV